MLACWRGLRRRVWRVRRWGARGWRGLRGRSRSRSRLSRRRRRRRFLLLYLLRRIRVVLRGCAATHRSRAEDPAARRFLRWVRQNRCRQHTEGGKVPHMAVCSTLNHTGSFPRHPNLLLLCPLAQSTASERSVFPFQANFAQARTPTEIRGARADVGKDAPLLLLCVSDTNDLSRTPSGRYASVRCCVKPLRCELKISTPEPPPTSGGSAHLDSAVT